MDKCIENIEECKSQIIEEICAIQEPTPAHITHTLDLYYELDCLGEQARIQFENRKGVDLSEKACILKYEIYHYAKITQNTYLLDLIHYFDTQFTEFQRYKIPTNIQLNYTNLSKQNLLGTISYSMNPYGLDQTPAWVYDFEQKGSNVGTKPILPSCVDTLNRKMYFYCRTTCCGIHQFDLLKHSVVDIIPFPHEPKGICVDLDFLYVLTCEGRPITNGMMKINISTKTVIKKWSEKTRPEFFGFETDGTDSLFTLRRSSLCVFSKTTLSQLRELKLAQNPKFSGKINTFSIFSNSVYILPEDIQFDILVYSLSNAFSMQHPISDASSGVPINSQLKRSKAFRDLVIANLKQIIQLTTALQSNKTLPNPVTFAKKLRAKSLATLEKWKEKYGMHYPRLRVAYRYIQGRKSHTIGQSGIPNVHQIRQEHQDRVRKALIKRDIEHISAEFDEVSLSIDETVHECGSCFELLVPRLADFDFRNIPVRGSELIIDEILSDEDTNILHNIPGNSILNSSSINDFNSSEVTAKIDHVPVVITGELNEMNPESTVLTCSGMKTSEIENPELDTDNSIKYDCSNSNLETEKNSDSIAAISEAKQSSEIVSNSDSEFSDSDDEDWEIVLPEIKAFNDYFDRLYQDFRMEIDLSKEKIQIILSPDNECIIEKLRNSLKSISIRLLPLILKWLNTIGISGNADLLTKVLDLKTKLLNVIHKAEVIELFNTDFNQIIPILPDSYSKLDNIDELSNNSKDNCTNTLIDPTSFGAQLTIGQRTNSNFNEPFLIGDDVMNPNQYLDYSLWDKGDKVANLPRYEGLHSYWVAEPENNQPSEAAIGMMQNRAFTYSEKFTPVFHTCDAPIGVNKFCKRKDRVKCPFHGKIVPRDEDGNALHGNSQIPQNSIQEPLGENIQDLIEDFPTLRRILTKVKSNKQNKNRKTNNKVRLISVCDFKNTKRRRLERILLKMERNLASSDQVKREMLEKNRANFPYNFNYAHNP
ncbi:UV-stimulated scaffold protein A-like [Oopsacas minuta]|uniref:UV-stimulated scaffold protein A-like n=1 Tax=Oopsacas minuta TaxID=111878 RepID=A0AAV7K8C2_9METZ|nr:UV-stimulated scaffold protein A-like [Oopsacas minuta]